MREKKYQVFVSSTYTDLKEERQAAVEAILSSGHIPAGMELFSAGDETQMTVIKRWIDESDIYMLIHGGRYGSIEPKSGKSYTHLEFEYALQQAKPMFAVVISDAALEGKVKIEGTGVLEMNNQQQLSLFRTEVTSRLVRFWDDKKDIKLAIHETISDFSHSKELIGWVRADNVVNTALLADEIASLSKENADLREKILNTPKDISPQYFGMSYDELIVLINQEELLNGFNSSEIIDFLYESGYRFTEGLTYPTDPEEKIIKLLKRVGIVINVNSTRFRFTDEGHSFYLRLRLKINETPPIL